LYRIGWLATIAIINDLHGIAAALLVFQTGKYPDYFIGSTGIPMHPFNRAGLIACLTALLLFAAFTGRANAQAPGWTFSIGQVSASPSPPGIYVSSPSTTATNVAGAGGGGNLIKSSATSIVFSFTVTGTFTPGPSQPTAPPVVETISTGWGVAPGNQATINDGFNDPTTAAANNSYVAGGTHITSANGTTFTDDVSITISFGAEPNEITGGGFTYSVQGQNLTLGLSTSLGATYHKGAPLTTGGPPVPVEDILNTTSNTLPVTTGLPYSAIIAPNQIATWIEYNAGPSGPWMPSSGYAWIDNYQQEVSSSSGTLSGTFNPSPFPYITTGYFGSILNGPATDQVTVAASDSEYTCFANGTFAVTFHQAAENWVKSSLPATYTFQEFGAPQEVSGLNNTTNITVTSTAFNWQLFGQSVSGALGIGTTVVCAVADPPAWLVAIAAAVGGGLSDLPAPAPSLHIFTCSSGQLDSDWNIQQQINNHTLPPALPPYTTMTQNMQNEMLANPNITNLLGNAAGGMVFVQPRCYLPNMWTYVNADGYGANGYYGQITSSFPRALGLDFLGYWDYEQFPPAKT
jgi:hypothetical protein